MVSVRAPENNKLGYNFLTIPSQTTLLSTMAEHNESRQTFMPISQTSSRTSMLPAATFPNANMSSNLAAYFEDEVEPQVLMPNVAYAHQDHTSRASSVNSAYQGSSPRKYSVGRELPRYVHTMVTVDLDVPITPPLFGGLPWQRHV